MTSATVPPKASVIDVGDFSRILHQPIRFRHSIGSSSLSYVGSSQNIGATNNSDDVVTEDNAVELPKFLKIRRLAIKENLIKNIKGNEGSTYQILQHLCFLNKCLFIIWT